MSYVLILPPASTPLERALEQTGAALLDFALPVRLVWSPAQCPVTHLPWLAWSVASSHWKTTWSVEYKRAAIADAIPYHRRKGTRRAVEEVLARYHPAFRIVEWHEANQRRAPHTFEVRAPASEIPASFLTAALAAEIVADVAIAKPARAFRVRPNGRVRRRAPSRRRCRPRRPVPRRLHRHPRHEPRLEHRPPD